MPPRRLQRRHIASSAVGLVLLAHYIVLASLGDPWNLGTLLSLLAALAALVPPILHRVGRPIRLGPRMQRSVSVLAAAVAAFYLATIVWICMESRSDEDQPVDVVLVLGAGLKHGRATPALERRIARASEYLVKNPEVPVVACGGVGPGQPLSEAELIRAELIRNGISPSRLHIESQSTSTVENLRFAYPIAVEATGTAAPRAMIVTSNFHLARAKLLARRTGFVPHGLPASTPWYVLPNTTAREGLAIVKSWIADR